MSFWWNPLKNGQKNDTFICIAVHFNVCIVQVFHTNKKNCFYDTLACQFMFIRFDNLTMTSMDYKHLVSNLTSVPIIVVHVFL